MPRLLLVDDNPSIHRIAESLLAPTDVELVCVDSAAEALDRLGRGERFDVALVDTAMPGMDGWTLLSRLRAMEETAAMPIALMAGVLDPVDPVKLAKAPIQGFLKKPIELRELGDRVKALLATPVVPPAAPSPFSTVPAMSAQDLIQRAEASLPEFRPERIDPGVSFLEPIEAVPAPVDDLLVLTADDLWPDERTGAILEPESLPEVQLELEELDLESLQELAVEPLAAGPATEAIAGPSLDALDAVFPDETLVTLSGLEELDLGPEEPLELAQTPAQAPAQTSAEPLPAPAPEVLELEMPALPVEVAPLVEPLPTLAPEALELEMPALPVDLAPLEGLPADLPPAEEAPAPSAVVDRAPASEPDASSLVAEVMSALGVPAASLMTPALEAAAVDGQAPAVPGQFPIEAPVPSAPVAMASKQGDAQAQAVVQAILADPVLVDALVKAVVARMGDQAIREIAWEVMPDLAGRLHS